MLLTTIFCEIDDFCKQNENLINKRLIGDKALSPKSIKSGRPETMRLSYALTIIVFWHHSKYRTFKHYYKNMVCGELANCFGNELVSYNRFVEIMPRMLPILFLLSQQQKPKNKSGIFYIDSFKLAVCHNARIYSHKVFKGLAQRGKTSTGWFYGFKIHLVINMYGEVMSFYVTPGNVSDKDLTTVDKITKKLTGLLFGDKGYISSKIFKSLYLRGLKLITKIQKNMRNKLVHLHEKLLLKKRGLVESVINIFKTGVHVEHTRHRSVLNFFVNTVSAVIAYNFKPNKPSICSDRYLLN
jgi:hypothetical protein